MPLANFPNGFRGGVQIAGFPVFNTYSTSAGPTNVSTAGVWYVDSVSGLDGNKGDSWYQPLATIQGAFTKAKANDIIMVKALHAETISSATAAAWNVAGVQVIGLGVGSQRPKITFDTAATSTITVSVASVSVTNIIFIANFLSTAAAFTLTTAKDFQVLGCEFRDTLAATNWLNIIKSTGAANTVDGLVFNDNNVSLIGTTFVGVFLIADAIRGFTVQRNTVNTISTGNNPALGLFTAGLVLGALITDNNCTCLATSHAGALLLTVSGGGTTSNGIIRNNFCQSLDASAGVLMITTLGFSYQGNSISGAAGAQGFPIPALDS